MSHSLSGNVVRALGPLESRALALGAATGRGGRGFLFVYPAGNGGVFKDSCALDGGDQSIYTLTLNAAGQNGSMPRYAENCTAVLATASSSGRYPEKYMVGTLHILLT